MIATFFLYQTLASYEVQKGDDDDDAFPNYKEGLGKLVVSCGGDSCA